MKKLSLEERKMLIELYERWEATSNFKSDSFWRKNMFGKVLKESLKKMKHWKDLPRG